MLDLKFYAMLLLRRIHYVLILAALGGAIGVTMALILPPTYRAEARMVVLSEQIPGQLAESTVRTEAVEQLQIIRQRILTREVLLDIANRLNVYPGGRDPATGQRLRLDEMVEDLRARIDITTESGRRRNQPAATLVNVAFTADRPNLASAVTNEIVTMILRQDTTIRTGRSGETLEFFEQQVERLDGELSEQGARIIRFQEENRDALPDSLEFRRGQLLAAQERLRQIDLDEDTLSNQRQNLEAIYAATGETPGEAVETLSPEAAALKEMEDRYRVQSITRSAEDPRVKALARQIEALRVVVEQQEAEVARAAAEATGADPEVTAPLSPFELQLQEIDRQVTALGEERVRLGEQMEALQESISRTPAVAVTLDQLQRDYENVRSEYDRAVTARARAETGDQIEALSKGERIEVIEQAAPPGAPTSPDRPKLIAAGLGGGLLAGLALVALLELLNNAVRRPVEITDKLDITPLATLPFVRTRGEVVRRRAMIAGAFAVVLAGLPLGLWAVDTYYAPIDQLADKVLDKLPFDRLLARIDVSGEGGT